MRDPLRKHLADLLDSSHAHLRFDDVIADWPRNQRGRKPPQAPHSAWQLLEHLRICQWDILEFSRDPEHRSPAFPEGYWPQSEEPPTEQAWDQSVAAFRADLRAMQELVADESVELLAPIAHGSGQTVLREALLLADHNAYHLGQLAMLRKLMDAWPGALAYRMDA
jgi:uncharacterized damage-inducible protein DinB